jgi:hypothetical protein
MGVKDFTEIQVYKELQVNYGGRDRVVNVELKGQGLTATVIVSGIGKSATRMVLNRDSGHVLAGAFTRALRDVQRVNRLRGVGGYGTTHILRDVIARHGGRPCTFDFAMEAGADSVTVKITRLAKKPITFELDTEDLRLITWFFNKGLFNVKVAQKIRY